MWNRWRVNLFVLAILVGIAILGVLESIRMAGGTPDSEWWSGLWQNFSTEVIGAILTFTLFELVVGGQRAREEKEEQRQRDINELIQQVRSSDNQLAAHAIKELRNLGLLESGALSNVDLGGVDLKQLDLTRANLNGVNLENANLNVTNLRSASLTLTNMRQTILVNANLIDANLSGASLTRAHLSGANLIYANLSGANLTNADLVDANLTNVNLTEASLTVTNLTRANLTDANLMNTDLARANLTNADLNDATLVNANLEGARLTNADLSGANLTNVNFKSTKLENAYFYNVNLKGANLTDKQLVSVNRMCKATMANGNQYDGRYRLQGDFYYATTYRKIDINSPEAMAEFYGVSLEQYLEGQKWADEHLDALRGE